MLQKGCHALRPRGSLQGPTFLQGPNLSVSTTVAPKVWRWDRSKTQSVSISVEEALASCMGNAGPSVEALGAECAPCLDLRPYSVTGKPKPN